MYAFHRNIVALEDKLSVSCDQIEILQSQVQESVERAQQSERRGKFFTAINYLDNFSMLYERMILQQRLKNKRPLV